MSSASVYTAVVHSEQTLVAVVVFVSVVVVGVGFLGGSCAQTERTLAEKKKSSGSVMFEIHVDAEIVKKRQFHDQNLCCFLEVVMGVVVVKEWCWGMQKKSRDWIEYKGKGLWQYP